MPAKYVLVPEKVRKKAHKLPFFIQNRLPETLLKIQDNPLVGEKLRGELDPYRKLRIGDYRIVYRFDDKISTVTIVTIEHRQGVYK